MVLSSLSRKAELRFPQMKWFTLISLALVSLSEGQSLIVEKRFQRFPAHRFSVENERQCPQAKSIQALSKFLSETVDKRTLTKWFGEPVLLGQKRHTPLPTDFVTTHYLQDPLSSGGSGGVASYKHESYFYSIEGAELGILYLRGAHSETTENGPLKTNSQWWGKGYFLAKWPQKRLGPYKDFPTDQLNEWEKQQTTAVLKVLWKKLAQDLKE